MLDARQTDKGARNYSYAHVAFLYTAYAFLDCGSKPSVASVT